MKPITLHPGSVLLGVALAGVLAVVAGAQSHGTALPIPIRDVRLVGEIPADWWVYIHVTAQPSGLPDQTYTVPSNRRLVVTDMYRQGMLRVDGQSMPALAALERGGAATGNGTRVVIQPGALIEAFNVNAGAQSELWGYLEPVQ